MYYMSILFLWKYLSLQGGSGPRFYQFEEDHGCSETWFWHFVFLNNLFPWRQNSNCLQETWYLANDLQFFILLCVLVTQFKEEKKRFYIILVAFALVSLVFQLIVICKNRMSASYLTYEDEYWSLYHYKPYSRVHSYLIGVYLGCEYFSYKHSPRRNVANGVEVAQPLVHQMFDTMKYQKQMMMLYMCLGVLMQVLMVLFHRWINMNPYSISEGWSVFYLLFCRPVFITGHSFFFMPIVLQNVSTKPLQKVLGHEHFIPYARLCYGIFLCNSMFL
jgi:peptidoglycan/LPS O-acetylase OafA/YrhL